MEDAVCRVCHGESEDDHPLFHPCKCSGSIKYVHQDCLLEWLKVSKKSEPKCELCGTLFYFTKKYCEDTPERLSVIEFMAGILPKVSSLVSTILWGLSVFLIWVISVPMWAWWTTENTLEYLLEGTIRLQRFDKFDSILDIVKFWWNGLAICIFTIVYVAALLEFAAFIRDEINLTLAEGGALLPDEIDLNDNDMLERRVDTNGDAVAGDIVRDDVVQRVFGDDDGQDDNSSACWSDVSDDDQETEAEGGDHPLCNGEPLDVPHVHDNSLDDQHQNHDQAEQVKVQEHPIEQLEHRQYQQLDEFNLGDNDMNEMFDFYPDGNRGGVNEIVDVAVAERVDTNSEAVTGDIVRDDMVQRVSDDDNDDDDGQDDSSSACWSDVNDDDDDEHQHDYRAEPEQEQEQPIEQQEQQQEHQHQHQQVPMPANGIADDVVMVDFGVLWSLSIRANLVYFLQFSLFIFFFIQVAMGLPTLLGRVVVFLLESAGGMRSSRVALIDFLEIQFAAVEGAEVDILSLATDANATSAMQKELFVTQIVVGLEFLTGWICMVLLLGAAFAWWLFRKFRTTAAGQQSTKEKLSVFFKKVINWTKIVSCIGLEMTILPQCIGWVVDIITLKAFDATFAERIEFLHEKPLVGGVLHFMVGFSFINLVSVFTTELRRVLKENVLISMLPEQDAMDFDLAVEGIWVGSLMKLFQRVLLTLFYCIPAMLVMLMLPVSFGHHFCPFAAPFRLNFNELHHDIQLPLELLVFQFLLPFLAHKFNHKQCIRFMVSQYVVLACHAMGFDDLLDAEVAGAVLRRRHVAGDVGEVRVEAFREQDIGAGGIGPDEHDVIGQLQGQEAHREANQSPRRREHGVMRAVKLLVLILGGLFLLFLGSTWFIHLPVIVGRSILAYLGVSIDYDVYCICVGFTVILGAGLSAKYMVNEMSQSAAALMSLCAKWLACLVKSVIVGVLWLVAAPLLFGLLFEVVIIIPIRTPFNESPTYPLLQCWAIGLLLLNVWLRTLMVGAFGDNIWRLRFDVCVLAGFTGIDLTFILKYIMAPIFTFMLDQLIVPFFFARTLGLCVTQSYFVRTVIMRFSFPLYLIMRVAGVGLGSLKEYVAKMHSEMLDSRYLVGTELTNRQ